MGSVRNRVEIWLLPGLFALMIVVVFVSSQVGQEKITSFSPSANNAGKEGVRALYLLYKKLGFSTLLMSQSWTKIPNDAGLFVYMDSPVRDRPLTNVEKKAMEKWIMNGGTVLRFLSPMTEDIETKTNEEDTEPKTNEGDPEPKTNEGDTEPKTNEEDTEPKTNEGDTEPITKEPDMFAILKTEVVDDPTLFGLKRVKVPKSKEILEIDEQASELFRGVTTLSIVSELRVEPDEKSNFIVLLEDDYGWVLAEKKIGKGRVLVYANRYGATNDGIKEEDNAILLYNIAQKAITNSNMLIAFDEYHNGLGFVGDQDGESKNPTWALAPIGMKLTLIHFVLVGLCVLYVGNRRFGRAFSTATASNRPRADYVRSMANLYRRAGASDLALEILLRRFQRDLKNHLELMADATPEQLKTQLEKRYGESSKSILEVLQLQDQPTGNKRLSEQELLRYTSKIEHFRREFRIV